MQPALNIPRSWWTRGRPYTLAEMIADGVVHGIGLVVAVVLGSILLAVAGFETAPREFPALIVYVASLLVVLSVSLAFNLCSIFSPAKRALARLDQAAIFLFIAGTYTPFLAMIGGTPTGVLMTILVWGAALVGIALKLIVPHRFGRGAIILYLAIGWSGVLVIHALATVLPTTTLWLVVAGGVTYSLGLVFHLWERLRFQNALWHSFVVVGASLHLWAIFDLMVLRRL